MNTEIFFVSRPCRELMNTFNAQSWEAAFHLENTLLDFTAATVHAHLAQTFVTFYQTPNDHRVIPATLQLKNLKAGLNLVPVRESFEYICGSLVVQDYSNIDLRKIADACIHYPFRVIKIVATRCRAQGIFTLAYFFAALSSEAGTDVVAMRKEAELDRIARASVPTPTFSSMPPTSLLSCDPETAAAMDDLDRRAAQL